MEKYFSGLREESREGTPSVENSSVSGVAEGRSKRRKASSGNGKTELTGARIITTHILFRSSSVFDSIYESSLFLSSLPFLLSSLVSFPAFPYFLPRRFRSTRFCETVHYSVDSYRSSGSDCKG